MSTQRPAFALLLLILFGIGGVAAPIAHEIDHSHQKHDAVHLDGSGDYGAVAHEHASNHGPCLCAVSLAALVSGDVLSAGAMQSVALGVDAASIGMDAAVEQPSDRGPPVRLNARA